MSTRATALLEQILALPPDERQLVTEGLYAAGAVGPAADDVWADPEWQAELDNRLAAVADGTAELIPADEAMARVRAELARRRAARLSGVTE